MNEVLEGAWRFASYYKKNELDSECLWLPVLSHLTSSAWASLPSSLPCCDVAHDVLSRGQIRVFALGFLASKTMTQTNLCSFYIVQPLYFITAIESRLIQ